ncbi:hypothetical protein JOF56_005709 [Kibdelosporangium banguiense]|uniref:Uncharacterized protein n=1 Tax=Kibdelosporangium banguiense TaxID=1365924 RepID=A0ABS4TLM5_9PSEU|nr:hypothetical protein [Kibdelosporangium banguiense]MBP2325324.1 hypothetical protein [Kibdelosporangium banguiense]
MAKFVLDDIDYPFDTDHLSNREVILLEKVTGASIGYLVDSFNSHGGTGRNAFFWLARRRLGEHVEYDELDYNYAALQFIPDAPGEPDSEEPAEERPDPTEAHQDGVNPVTEGK